MTARSYEEQLKVWASKRYRIPLQKIATVNLDVVAYSNVGCPTCGPETTHECDVEVLGPKGGRLRSETITLDWSGDFAALLKEIIEA